MKIFLYLVLLFSLMDIAGREVGFYLWQRDWSEAVQQATANCPGKIYLFAAELDGGKISRSNVRLDIWRDRNITAVFRVRVEGFSQDGFKQLVEEIKRIGAERIQLDIDVPERRLGEYVQRLSELKINLAGEVKEWSITVLPCHLKHVEFSDVAKLVDYYVLQVHGLEAPKHIDDNYFLIDGKIAREAVGMARKLPYRFKVALPCYAYILWFDKDSGAFVTLSAEGYEPPPKKYNGRLAAPELKLLRDLLKENQNLDVIWFRLPTGGDRLCYDLEVLRQLEQGILPKPSCLFEYRQVAENAIEIWMTLYNQLRFEPVTIFMQWRNKAGEFELPSGVQNISKNLGFAILPERLEIPFAGCGQATRIGTFLVKESQLIKIEEDKR